MQSRHRIDHTPNSTTGAGSHRRSVTDSWPRESDAKSPLEQMSRPLPWKWDLGLHAMWIAFWEWLKP